MWLRKWQMQEALNRITARLNDLSRARKQHQDAMQQHDLAKHALDLVEGRANCSAGCQAQKYADGLRKQLEEVTAQRDAASAKKAELEDKAEVWKKLHPCEPVSGFCCSCSALLQDRET